MNDVRKGKVYAALFVFFIIVLIVGGYMAMVYLTSGKEPQKEKTPEVKQSLKIDEDKDYLYFTNVDLKNEDYNIIYQDVNINLDSSEARSLENNLNNAMADLKSTYKLISEANLTEEENEKVLFTDSGIYEASYIKYTRYISPKYISLLVDYYEFNCYSGEKYLSSIAYVFDVKTGKLLSNNEVLKLYDYSLDKLKQKVRDHLQEEQKEVEEVVIEEEEEKIVNKDLIDIDSTIKSLDDDNYALFIDKSGFLTVSYLVKSTKVDYNDIMILN